MVMPVLFFALAVPPQHELFDHEEDPEARDQRHAQTVGARRSRPPRSPRAGARGSAAPSSAPVAKLRKCGSSRALCRSGTHSRATAKAALAMPPSAAHRMIHRSSGKRGQLLGGDFGADPSTRPAPRSGGEPDERGHAAALPVAAVGKEARAIGVGAPRAPEHLASLPPAAGAGARARAGRTASARARWRERRPRRRGPAPGRRRAPPRPPRSAADRSQARATRAGRDGLSAQPRERGLEHPGGKAAPARVGRGDAGAVAPRRTTPAGSRPPGRRRPPRARARSPHRRAAGIAGPRRGSRPRPGRAPARASAARAAARARARTRARFSCTWRGRSPTCAPTLSVSKGAALTPPPRSVKAARTHAGAGQAGSRHASVPPAGSLTRRRLPAPPGARCMSAGSGASHASSPAAHRMHEPQARRVQRLAREARQRLHQRRGATGGQAAAAAVDRIADHREAGVRQMHADLVGAPGLELDAHQRVRAEAAHHAVVGDRGTPVGCAPPCACAACGGGRSAHRSCRRRS